MTRRYAMTPMRNELTPKALDFRKKAGKYVRACREAVGKTQAELAKEVGLGSYQVISAIERGLQRIPSESIKLWAQALERPSRDFGKKLLKFQDPYFYDAIFVEEDTTKE